MLLHCMYSTVRCAGIAEVHIEPCGADDCHWHGFVNTVLGAIKTSSKMLTVLSSVMKADAENATAHGP